MQKCSIYSPNFEKLDDNVALDRVANIKNKSEGKRMDVKATNGILLRTL